MVKRGLAFFTAIICSGFIFFSCSGNQADSQDSIDQLLWLTGKWKGSEDSTDIYEIWKKESATTLSCNAYSLEFNGDTSFTEKITIVRDYEDWYYVVYLPKREPVRFKLIKQAKDKLIFENSDNPFPSKIIYYLPDPNRLTVQLLGVRYNGDPVITSASYAKSW